WRVTSAAPGSAGVPAPTRSARAARAGSSRRPGTRSSVTVDITTRRSDDLRVVSPAGYRTSLPRVAAACRTAPGFPHGGRGLFALVWANAGPEGDLGRGPPPDRRPRRRLPL